jgi:predicted amidohydrolase
LNAPTTLEQVINVEIDLQSVNQAREKLPVLADRKL